MTTHLASAQKDDYSYPSWTAPSYLFPVKLHKLITAAEESGNQDIVCWLPDGKSFIIKDRARFVSQLMPSFFGASKFRSFQRNLNLWNFVVEDKFPHKGEVSHPYFQRDHPELSEQMKREKVKNKDLVKAKMEGTTTGSPVTERGASTTATVVSIPQRAPSPAFSFGSAQPAFAVSSSPPPSLPSPIHDVSSLLAAYGAVPGLVGGESTAPTTFQQQPQHWQPNVNATGDQSIRNLLDLMAYQEAAQKIQALTQLNDLLRGGGGSGGAPVPQNNVSALLASSADSNNLQQLFGAV